MCLFGKMCRLLSRKLRVIPKVCKVMYCGSINGCLTGRDWYWTMRLLIACKKAVTRSWYKTEPPPAKQWLEIVREVFVMTYKLRLREDTFGSKWENCMRNLWLHNGLVFSYIPTYGLSFMSFFIFILVFLPSACKVTLKHGQYALLHGLSCPINIKVICKNKKGSRMLFEYCEYVCGLEDGN